MHPQRTLFFVNSFHVLALPGTSSKFAPVETNQENDVKNGGAAVQNGPLEPGSQNITVKAPAPSELTDTNSPHKLPETTETAGVVDARAPTGLPEPDKSSKAVDLAPTVSTKSKEPENIIDPSEATKPKNSDVDESTPSTGPDGTSEPIQSDNDVPTNTSAGHLVVAPKVKPIETMWLRNQSKKICFHYYYRRKEFE